jgi:hypothetical protein
MEHFYHLCPSKVEELETESMLAQEGPNLSPLYFQCRWNRMKITDTLFKIV